MGQQIRQPGGVIHVGFAPRHGLDVVGVGQHQLKVPRQDGPDRFPVHAGGLHRDGGDAMAGQPFREPLQLRCRGGEGLDKADHTAGLGQAHASHDGVPMNVEPGTACVETIHDRLPLRTAPARSPG
jgi:hypothetical protein